MGCLKIFIVWDLLKAAENMKHLRPSVQAPPTFQGDCEYCTIVLMFLAIFRYLK
jgi:hypothetical protein